MLCQLSRASRASSVVAAVARSARAHTQARSFIAPTVSRRADFVQELYLKELKAYKVPPVKESDAEGQVQAFAMPKTPASPEETDLAGSLKQYETMAVDIDGQDAASSQPSQGAASLPDWLETDEDESRGQH